MNFRRCYGGSRVGCDPGQCILGRLGRKGLVPPARSPSPLRVVRSPLLSPRISALLRAEARVSAPASGRVRAGAWGCIRARTRACVWWRLHQYWDRDIATRSGVFVFVSRTLTERIPSGGAAMQILSGEEIANPRSG